MKRGIVVVGSIALDSIETPYGKVEEVLGGSAVHFSVAASFFAPVGVVGVVGDDFPPKYLKLLSRKRKAIDLSGVKVSNGRTFRWRGYYKNDMNTAYTIETQLNVFENFVPEIPREYHSSSCVFLANIDPELQYKVLLEMRDNSNMWLSACDTRDFWIEREPEKVKRVFSCVNIVMINEEEIRRITGEMNLPRAARRIHALSSKVKAVVVKRGEYGVAVFGRDFVFCLPGYLLEKVKDPTGAGDTFAGGFLGSLVRFGKKVDEKNLRRAAVYGCVLASFNVEDFGLRRLLRLSKDEIEERYNEFKAMTSFC